VCKDVPILASVTASVPMLHTSVSVAPVPIPETNDQQYCFSTAGQTVTDRQNRIGSEKN